MVLAALLVMLVIALGIVAWSDPSGRSTIFGALGAIGGGIAGAIFVGYLEEVCTKSRRLEAHKVVVMAVLMELAVKVQVIKMAGRPWGIGTFVWRLEPRSTRPDGRQFVLGRASVQSRLAGW